jgi:hypothetical protein
MLATSLTHAYQAFFSFFLRLSLQRKERDPQGQVVLTQWDNPKDNRKKNQFTQISRRWHER